MKREISVGRRLSTEGEIDGMINRGRKRCCAEQFWGSEGEGAEKFRNSTHPPPKKKSVPGGMVTGHWSQVHKRPSLDNPAICAGTPGLALSFVSLFGRGSWGCLSSAVTSSLRSSSHWAVGCSIHPNRKLHGTQIVKVHRFPSELRLFAACKCGKEELCAIPMAVFFTPELPGDEEVVTRPRSFASSASRPSAHAGGSSTVPCNLSISILKPCPLPGRLEGT